MRKKKEGIRRLIKGEGESKSTNDIVASITIPLGRRIPKGGIWARGNSGGGKRSSFEKEAV